MSIYFYGHTKPNGEFSNFFPCEFTDGKITFNCSEQYFMYMKVVTFEPNNGVLIKKVLSETRPSYIKRYGSRKYLKTFDEKVWSERRFDIMLVALRLKFGQNEHLKAHLLSTGTKMLYEASHRDAIWGIGYGYKQAQQLPPEQYGQNLLGKALMIVRDELSQEIAIEDDSSE